jgi:hypothetical protein
MNFFNSTGVFSSVTLGGVNGGITINGKPLKAYKYYAVTVEGYDNENNKEELEKFRLENFTSVDVVCGDCGTVDAQNANVTCKNVKKNVTTSNGGNITADIIEGDAKTSNGGCVYVDSVNGRCSTSNGGNVYIKGKPFGKRYTPK